MTTVWRPGRSPRWPLGPSALRVVPVRPEVSYRDREHQGEHEEHGGYDDDQPIRRPE